MGALLLYTFGLTWAPVNLHFDEIRFAEQARSIAATGLDLRGRFLPVYFQMEATLWFHPIGVYLPALAFKLFGVSTVALRAPTAVVGAVNVVLLYFIARRLRLGPTLSLIAGALLAIAPAHFIHSRMAVDYLFPAPFVLGWCLLLLRFLDTGSHRTLFAATTMLGLGVYSYIAAVALMPLFVALTILVLWLEGRGLRSIAIAIAGFAWVLIPAAWFIAAHPEMLGSTLGRYGIVANQLDMFQRVRETLTPWFISDRANLYLTFFAPGYLFVTGGNALAGSTREAGVFLMATLPLMLIGFRAGLLRYSPQLLVILGGVLLPPLAASVVVEPFAVGRAITMVPFALLLAVLGIDQLLRVTPAPSFVRMLTVVGMGAAALGIAYLIYRGARGGFTPGGLALAILGAALVIVAAAVRAGRTLWPIVIALLVACAWQFTGFARDYFGDYRARSAFWFNGNLRGTVARVVDEIDRRGPREVLLDQGVNSIDWFWRFHVAELGRGDLEKTIRVVTPDQLRALPLAPGTLFVAPALDETLRALAESRAMTVIATIDDPGDQPSYLLFESR